jgi:hypothetical protein
VRRFRPNREGEQADQKDFSFSVIVPQLGPGLISKSCKGVLMMRPTFDVSWYLVLIFPPIVVVALLLLQRVRAQMRSADPASLERLRRDGVLYGDSGEQYRQVMRLLAGISPAVWLRERTSVRLYGGGVRWLACCLPSAQGVQREMARVTAYQAHRYANALAQLQQLRDDRFWGLQTASKLPQ